MWECDVFLAVSHASQRSPIWGFCSIYAYTLWRGTNEFSVVTHTRGGVCFRRSATPLHIAQCVARFVSDSWNSNFCYRASAKCVSMQSTIFIMAFLSVCLSVRLSATLRCCVSKRMYTLSHFWHHLLGPFGSIRVTKFQGELLSGGVNYMHLLDRYRRLSRKQYEYGP